MLICRSFFNYYTKKLVKIAKKMFILPISKIKLCSPETARPSGYTKKLVKIAKKDVHFAYFEKKTMLAQNSATKWSHEKIFLAKIFTVKNYTMSEVFRFI